MRISAHAPTADGRQRGDVGSKAPSLVEQFFRPVAAHPFLEQPQVFGILAHLIEWNLVGAPESFDLLAIDLLGAGPAFRAPQDDEWPARRLRVIAFAAIFPRQFLNRVDFLDHLIEDRSHALVHRHRI